MKFETVEPYYVPLSFSEDDYERYIKPAEELNRLNSQLEIETKRTQAVIEEIRAQFQTELQKYVNTPVFNPYNEKRPDFIIQSTLKTLSSLTPPLDSKMILDCIKECVRLYKGNRASDKDNAIVKEANETGRTLEKLFHHSMAQLESIEEPLTEIRQQIKSKNEKKNFASPYQQTKYGLYLSLKKAIETMHNEAQEQLKQNEEQAVRSFKALCEDLKRLLGNMTENTRLHNDVTITYGQWEYAFLQYLPLQDLKDTSFVGQRVRALGNIFKAHENNRKLLTIDLNETVLKPFELEFKRREEEKEAQEAQAREEANRQQEENKKKQEKEEKEEEEEQKFRNSKTPPQPPRENTKNPNLESYFKFMTLLSVLETSSKIPDNQTKKRLRQLTKTVREVDIKRLYNVPPYDQIPLTQLMDVLEKTHKLLNEPFSQNAYVEYKKLADSMPGQPVLSGMKLVASAMLLLLSAVAAAALATTGIGLIATPVMLTMTAYGTHRFFGATRRKDICKDMHHFADADAAVRRKMGS